MCSSDLDEALQRLRRELKDRKPLQELGTGPVTRFGLQGVTVVELKLVEGGIDCAIAKKVSQRPDWLRSSIRSAADVRKALDAVTRQLKLWVDED